MVDASLDPTLNKTADRLWTALNVLEINLFTSSDRIISHYSWIQILIWLLWATYTTWRDNIENKTVRDIEPKNPQRIAIRCIGGYLARVVRYEKPLWILNRTEPMITLHLTAITWAILHESTISQTAYQKKNIYIQNGTLQCVYW